MGWSSHDEEFRADYERDLRRDWEPRTPVQLQPGPLSTAMDIALIVRGMNNLFEAGKLIEQWHGWKVDAERLEAVRAGVGR